MEKRQVRANLLNFNRTCGVNRSKREEYFRPFGPLVSTKTYRMAIGKPLSGEETKYTPQWSSQDFWL